MKKLASVLLALALLLSLSVAVFAEETYTITADSNRSYEVYQIFTGDLYTKTDGTKVLSNIKWGADSQPAEGESIGTKVSDSVLTSLKALVSKTDKEKVDGIEEYVNWDSTSKKTVANGSSISVEPGYYLLKDITELSSGQEHSQYIIQVVGPVTVTAKAGNIVPNKQVKDKNDSTGTESGWQGVADYDIGDDVPFKLSATITSNYDNYDSYYLCFHDTLSTGLSFNENSVKVMVGNYDITSSFTVVSNPTDGCTFEVKCNDLKQIKDTSGNSLITADSIITVEYTAKLTTDAVIGAAGNSNKMHLEYSNDPNSASTGNTPDQEVKVFTYKLIINKKDDKNQDLTGAGFTLYKKIADSTEQGYYWDEVGVVTSTAENPISEFTWTGLDEGDYKLVETTTPPGYNTMEDILFTIDSTTTTTALTALTSKITGTDDDFGTVETDKGTITADVVNNAGTVLPETGASGTTLFLIFGSMLTLAAVVFLAVRKKMSIYED